MNPATVRTATPYGFLLPALIVTALVIVYPVVQTVWLSLQDFILYAPDDGQLHRAEEFPRRAAATRCSGSRSGTPRSGSAASSALQLAARARRRVAAQPELLVARRWRVRW